MSEATRRATAKRLVRITTAPEPKKPARIEPKPEPETAEADG